jgi:DNA-binding transcriptional ArsR family regulator
MDPDLIAACKVLTDPGRLRVVGQLVPGPMSADDLAAALGDPRRSIRRHLGLLVGAGIAVRRRDPVEVYHLDLGRLTQLAVALDALDRSSRGSGSGPPAPQGRHDDAPAGDARVLRGFLDDDGRLTGIPTQRSKRLVVLAFLARTVFEPGRDYPEREVNMLLALRHPDVASLRRYLVDEGFMDRAAGIYRLRSPG